VDLDDAEQSALCEFIDYLAGLPLTELHGELRADLRYDG